MKETNILEDWKEWRDKFSWRTFGKKGQSVTPITVMFLVFFFLVVWGLFFGGFINTTVSLTLANHTLGGFDRFLWSWLNLWIFLGLIGFMLAYKFMVS